MITLGIRLALLLSLLTLLTGCNGGDPIQRWQVQVKDYIEDQGNGDINALRNYGEPAAQRTFSMLGASEGGIGLLSPTRDDSIGVLLGRTIVDGDAWFVYLLGIVNYKDSMTYLPVDNARVIDIRLAALRLDARGNIIWRITPPDDAQLNTYIATQQAAWAHRYGTSDNAITEFPTERDSFEMSVNQSAHTITANERTSGASWTLHLIEEEQPQQESKGR